MTTLARQRACLVLKKQRRGDLLSRSEIEKELAEELSRHDSALGGQLRELEEWERKELGNLLFELFRVGVITETSHESGYAQFKIDPVKAGELKRICGDA